MLTRSKGVRGSLWALIICVAASHVAAAQVSPNELFDQLRKVDQHVDRPSSGYYDLHGNAHPDLQALMIMRFEATASICHELDSTDRKKLPAYAAALYDVLATVKDPASIPWLKRQLAGRNRSEIYRHWLPHWRTYLRGAEPEEEKWLAGPEKWTSFFQDWFKDEKAAAQRTALLDTMRGWCHSARTIEFFKELERDEGTRAEDLLIVELYLQQHGNTLDSRRLQQAIRQTRSLPASDIDSFRKSRSQSAFYVEKHVPDSINPILLEYADELRRGEFVPWLLEVVQEYSGENYGDPQWVLEAITFCRDVRGRDGWQEWARTYAGGGRQAWLERASSQILQLATTNSPAAAAFLERAMYRWKDPLMLPTMQRLAAFKALHSEVVGWINLTYGHHHHVPQLRGQLRALALRIQEDGEQGLQDWAKRLMREWDFLYEDKASWEQFVCQANRRI